MNWSSDEELKLSNFLIKAIVDRALGQADQECEKNYPRDSYFLGNLRPRDADTLTSTVGARELLNKLAPSATGWELAVQPQEHDVRLNVKVSWSVYYRAFPTFRQQRDYQVRNSKAQNHESLRNVPGAQGLDAESGALMNEAEAPSEVPSKASESKDAMAPRFKPIRCQAEGELTVNSGSPSTVNVRALQNSIDLELERAINSWRDDPDRIRAKDDASEYIQVPLDALAHEDSYKVFTESLAVEVKPQWRLTIESTLLPNSTSDALVVGLDVINTSPATRVKGKENPNLEHFIFNPIFDICFIEGTPVPFVLELAPEGFRYDRHLWGQGFNCSITRDSQNHRRFITSHVPIFKQNRYSTRSTPSARFVDLAQDPVPVLEAIHQAMKAYSEVWVRQRVEYAQNDPMWEETHGREFDDDFRQYKDEISRFEAGLDLIRKDADVRYAFMLTNETFFRGGKQGWRLFQIVFLVTQVPGTAALRMTEFLDERKKVDIIYFPTGGGKTEAYLGVVVFHCFYDRLRGKSAGVTAWTRFPLRLLTLQQTQRVTDTIGIAELLRREQSDKRLNSETVDGFAVGYFVGEGGSPNELADPAKVPFPNGDLEIAWAMASDPTARQKWKRIARCPSCRTDTVLVDFDAVKVRLIHRCTNTSCKFPEGVVPIFIVDNEIYRNLPSVVVGTIDKLAGIGNQRKMALILGKAEGRCSIHGYFRQKCCQKDCTDRKVLKKILPNDVSGPTLFVQDELHLLKEGLGTFDSHYETFTQMILKEFGYPQTLKIIASSATIEAFERQVSHLYGRNPKDARVFPGPGPTLGNSFYAETLDYYQRLYVGVIPHNKTILNTILELIEHYHRAIYELRTCTSSSSPFGGTVLPGSQAWNELIDLYSTSLTYFIARHDLNPIRTDLVGDVFPRFESEGIPVPRIHELTGSTSTDEVQHSLESLERASSDVFQSDSVLATSMVSHGVDIDRLNAMIFYGMPRQNAEYIQASSRVGRAHTGLVFTCLHPVRERDQSHYKYYVKFHEFLGQLIEPVAINRWATFSLSRTLPGLFMAVLLQKLANEPGETKPDGFYLLEFVRKKISAGEITPELFIPLLESAYIVPGGSPEATSSFKAALNRLVLRFFDQIVSAGAPNKFVSQVLIPKPLRSLRDVDEPIEIELDSEGTEWSRKSATQRG